MKKLLKNKKLLVLLCLIGLVFLAGCQKNTDANGNTLPERIIYLTTPWSDMFDESIFTAILIYPLAQCINFIGTYTHSAILGVVVTTILYNLLTLKISINSTASSQKLQIIQPEISKIQAKYEGRTDDAARMQQAQELQQIYNKYGVNPLSSLAMPFLTFPIMIAMFYASQRAAVVCEGSALGVPLTTTPRYAFQHPQTCWVIIIIFVIMLILQFISGFLPQVLAKKRIKEKKGYKAYDQPKQNNSATIMMVAMLLLVGVIALNWPASMSVYWAVSSFVNILKTLYIQKRYVDNA